MACKQKNWHFVATKTIKNKYDCENVFQSDAIKKKIKTTNLQKYGDEFPTRFNGDIFAQVMHNKYGENWRNVLSKKGTTAFKEKYGVDNPSNLQSIVDKAKATKFDRLYKIEQIDNIVVDKLNNAIQYTCDKCNNVSTLHPAVYLKRLSDNENICPVCNPIKKVLHKEQHEIFEFVESICKHTVCENVKNVLPSYELDIYVPDMKIAIEFDGIYWHNELFKEPNYHLRKTEECDKYGIKLVHVFESEWLYKQEIVKSRLSSIFNHTAKLYARQCKIGIVSNDESIQFLNANHIQGACSSKYRYGLYCNNELVSLMTFGKSRFKKNEIELLRFCNKLNTTVVGGASKLLSAFLKDNSNIHDIVSYADRRWSTGNLYEKLGFEKISVSKPNYYYVVDGILKNRMNYQKHLLIKQGFDASKAEHDIMLERKIYRIYDCGTLKYYKHIG